MGVADELARHNADLAKYQREKSRHDLLHVGPPPRQASEVLPAVQGRHEAGRGRATGEGREAGARVTDARPEEEWPEEAEETWAEAADVAVWALGLANLREHGLELLADQEGSR